MVGRHQLQRGLIARRYEPRGVGDDAAAAQGVEHRDLLLVEQAGLDDLGHHDVGWAREVDDGRVALDDANAVRDRWVERDAAPQRRRADGVDLDGVHPPGARRGREEGQDAATGAGVDDDVPGRTTARIASRKAHVRASSFRHMYGKSVLDQISLIAAAPWQPRVSRTASPLLGVGLGSLEVPIQFRILGPIEVDAAGRSGRPCPTRAHALAAGPAARASRRDRPRRPGRRRAVGGRGPAHARRTPSTSWRRGCAARWATRRCSRRAAATRVRLAPASSTPTASRSSRARPRGARRAASRGRRRRRCARRSSCGAARRWPTSPTSASRAGDRAPRGPAARLPERPHRRRPGLRPPRGGRRRARGARAPASAARAAARAADARPLPRRAPGRRARRLPRRVRARSSTASASSRRRSCARSRRRSCARTSPRRRRRRRRRRARPSPSTRGAS